VIKGSDGEDVDLSNVKSETKAKKREFEVIKDSDKMQGILTKDTYMCSKRIDGFSCDSTEVYAYLEQTRSSDEPETRMLTCKACGHGWREY
jgi:DNA-directed RNA polymerase subunit M/transcription elongation factor TFIIS